ncbi:hypothetical protein [Hydrogenophaga sp.]|uniref:hypothetical protein n=1 Tax=Hydrogenophaga sp. TaxID=1904254 RepID=UPI0027317613|nr:hypothetical protein [Hydrogenophaga sp.]
MNSLPPLVRVLFMSTLLVCTAWLAGCASAPPVSSVAVVAVMRTVNPGDLEGQHAQTRQDRQALRDAGVDSNAVAAGRVVRVACAMMTDGTWGGLGILPPGAQAAPGSVWRLQVGDVGSNERTAVNALIAPLPELTWSGKSAYTFVPNWRELGRWTNIDPVELPKDQRGHYHIVFSHFLVSCRP